MPIHKSVRVQTSPTSLGAKVLAEGLTKHGVWAHVKKVANKKSWWVMVMDTDVSKATKILQDVYRREPNPLQTISGSTDGGWQAAHAFRQLPDGRVQILTNPKGRVPHKLVGRSKKVSMTLKEFLKSDKRAYKAYSEALTPRQAIIAVNQWAKWQGIKLVK